MDHVIDSLRRWLDIYETSEPDNKRAHECIENALKELYKYYPDMKDRYGNPLK